MWAAMSGWSLGMSVCVLLERSSVVDLTSMLDEVSGDVCNECSSNDVDCI